MSMVEGYRWDIVFSTMTRMETDFIALVAKQFQSLGYSVACLTYDQSALVPLAEAKIPYISVHDMVDTVPYPAMKSEELSQFLSTFGIHNIRDLFIHEMLRFGMGNEEPLFRKTVHFLATLDSFFSMNKIGCILEEVGGFVANTTLFYAARRHGIQHIFWEPSPFPKRIVFTRNGFYPELPKSILNTESSHEARSAVAKLRDEYLATPAFVIPAKDRHNFRDMTVSRMFNAFNAKRLLGKLYRKYISGQREEFNVIDQVVRANLVKLIRRLMFSRFYVSPSEATANRYVYYPLHVPQDVQLTVRSKLFYFQEALVEYLCRVLPHGYMLLVKEHPAGIGSHSYQIWKRLLRQYTNLRLLHPRHNSFDLIRMAALVISVNSKVGFEAIMQQKKVIVVGDPFYKGKGVTFDVENMRDVERIILQALEADPPDKERVMDFLAKVYAWSFPCDLYETSLDNVKAGFESFYSFLQENNILPQRCDKPRFPQR